MSIHDEMDALADLYAGGGLDPGERLEVEQHAASCGACAAVLRDARDFASWLGGVLAPDAPPDGLEDRIVGRLRKGGSRTKGLSRFLPGAGLLKAVGSIAAALLLIVIGYMFVERSENCVFRQEGDGKSISQLLFGLEGRSGPGTPETYALTSESRATFIPKNQYDRDVNGLKEYADALERDNAKLRPAKEAYDRAKGEGENTAKAARISDAQKEIDALKVTLKKTEAGLEVEDRKTAAVFYALADRKIIHNAQIDLEVDSCEVAQRRIAEIAAAEKGFVAGADTERLPNNKVKAVVTLRIPPDRYEAALARLRELGTVRHQSIGSQDVTKAYTDLDARLGAKQALVDRLKKVLAEAKGNVKELMEVEVQMGKTIEEIESIKGELKYYDNQVALATIILRLAEKDLGQPFEYVQTLSSAIALTARDADDAYAKAQKAIVDAGGQVVDSKMTRQNDGSAKASIKGRVDAEKFPALREGLRSLGHVDNDTVDQQKTARGGSGDAPKPDAPVRREQAVIDLTIETPPILFTRGAVVAVEAVEVESAYQSARKAVEAAGGRITEGSLSGRSGQLNATVKAQVDADRFPGIVDQLKALGAVKDARISIELPANVTGGSARPIVERGNLNFTVVSPPQLISGEKGLAKMIRDTFSGSVAGLLLSVEYLFVGICLVAPWLVIPVVAWFVWRRRKARAAAPRA